MTRPRFKYFRIGTETAPASLRKQYLKYCKIHHPDTGGNATDFAEMKEEYECALQYLKKLSENNAKTQQNENKRHKLTNSQFLEEIKELLEEVQCNPIDFDIHAFAKEIKTIGIKAGIGIINSLFRK